MTKYAVAYAPNLSGGQPVNTTTTASFYIGNMSTRSWNQAVPQTTVNTLYAASPDDGDGYLIALPNPTPSPASPWNGLNAPQFFKSLTNGAAAKTDAAFIATCDYILKNYKSDGTTGTPKINPAGCATVGACQTAINLVGWQSYGFVPPA